MRARLISLLVALALLVSTAHADEAPGASECAPASLEGVILASGPIVLAPGGGVVAGLRGFYRPGRRARGFPPRGALEAGGQRRPLAVEHLAPGLARFVPSAAVPPGTYRVEGAHGRAEVTVAAGPRPAPPAAPRVDAVTLSRSRPGGAPSVEVSLSAPAPTGVVALIAWWGSRPGRRGLFGRASVGARTVRLNGFSVRCVPPPATFGYPLARQPARLRFVDRHGQLSPLSAPTRVRGR